MQELRTTQISGLIAWMAIQAYRKRETHNQFLCLNNTRISLDFHYSGEGLPGNKLSFVFYAYIGYYSPHSPTSHRTHLNTWGQGIWGAAAAASASLRCFLSRSWPRHGHTSDTAPCVPPRPPLPPLPWGTGWLLGGSHVPTRHNTGPVTRPEAHMCTLRLSLSTNTRQTHAHTSSPVFPHSHARPSPLPFLLCNDHWLSDVHWGKGLRGEGDLILHD